MLRTFNHTNGCVNMFDFETDDALLLLFQFTVDTLGAHLATKHSPTQACY